VPPRSASPTAAVLAVALLVLPLRLAAAEDGGHRLTIVEENDSMPFHSDKHYTQGLRLSYLAPPVGAESFWAAPFDIFPWMQAAPERRSRRYAILVGQSLFTPKDTDLSPPDPDDRPYAGWLYGGVSLLQETDRFILDHVELQVGMAGPAALGKATQNEYHQLIGATEAKGWSKQIQNELGVVVEIERKWRLGLAGANDRSFVDIVPEAGAVAGNVFTYGKLGALLRIGTHLGADYGPVRITPALSGTDYVDPARLPEKFGFYLFVGAEGRAVGRNLFLDGNLLRDSRSVDKKTFVGDLQAGISIFFSDRVRIDAAAMRRSPEFEGQGSPDVLAMVGLSLFW
jgi:hypothetical protein